MLHEWDAGDQVDADDLNNNFNSIEVVGTDLTLGESITGPKAVYVKASDGKLYKTDGGQTDERLLSYIGFIINGLSGVADGVKHFVSEGIIDGFSTLTKGSSYFLAKAGTTQADISGGASASGTNHDIGVTGGTPNRYAREFTTSEKGKLISFTLNVLKQGSPAGNLACEIRKGQPSGTGSDGGGTLIASASVAASGISTSFANHAFTFATPVLLPAGQYYAVFYHDTESNGNNFQVESNASAATAWGWSSGSWANNKADTLYSIDFNTETFAAGDISDYFYDYECKVGVAIAADKIKLERGSFEYIGKATASSNQITTPAAARFAIVQIASSPASTAKDGKTVVTLSRLPMYLTDIKADLNIYPSAGTSSGEQITATWLTDKILLSGVQGSPTITAYFFR